MSLTGPIILIDDDVNDLDVIIAALKDNEFKNEARCFLHAKDALNYLLTTTELPFIILCDIRLPVMNGLQLRSAINENEFLRKKSIPFLFYTGAVSQDIVNEAYHLTVQGLMAKPVNYNDMKDQLKAITDYWTKCLHPNSFGI